MHNRTQSGLRRRAMLLALCLLAAVPACGQSAYGDSTRQARREAHREALSQNTQQMDSLTSTIAALQQELGQTVERIEGVTEDIEDNTFFDWKAWIAWIVGLLALAVAWITYRAQNKTEGNTKKLSQNAQRDLLVDLVRHLYRNYVITYTMRTKMEDIDYRGYPSEEHFLKLKIPMENLHLDAFYGEDAKYKTMHNLYLNLRNYNEEVDVAMKHLTDRGIGTDTKKEDFDTLEFKVSYLTRRIMDVLSALWGNGTDDVATLMALRASIAAENSSNATGNQPVEGCEAFGHLTLEQAKGTSYARIYTTEEALAGFVARFNEDVKTDRMKNQRGAWKVRVVRFV